MLARLLSLVCSWCILNNCLYGEINCNIWFFGTIQVMGIHFLLNVCVELYKFLSFYD